MSEKKNYKMEIAGFIIALVIVIITFLDFANITSINFDQKAPSELIDE